MRLIAVIAAAGILAAAHLFPLAAREVPNFALLDRHGKYHELHHTEARVLVLFFTGNGCPIARQSSGKLREIKKSFGKQGVDIWVVNSYPADSLEDIRKEAQKHGFQQFPLFKDQNQALGTSFGVQRTAEVIAINTKSWEILYRGAIDDQLSEGAKKPSAENRYLATALEEFFAGKTVSTASTKAKGCLITYEASASPEKVSYEKDVAPILAAKCVNCHSKGNIGPFALTSYNTVKNKSRMIEEVILTKRMPPWHADPHYGTFANDRSLTAQETQVLLGWIREGSPRGEGEDPLGKVSVSAEKWILGKPDYVLALPEPQNIPATGVLEYRHITLRNPVTNDVWLGAIVPNPGNRKVLHHIILRAKHASLGDDGSGRGTMLCGWAPGYAPEKFPQGTGRFLPAGAELDVELHYTTMGSEETDLTEIGLYVLPEKPRLDIRVGAAINTDFQIPPGESDSRTFATQGVQTDTLLFGVSPHMHVRGSWFKFEALYPDGKKQTLLSVPKYDFNWQTGYTFAEPIKLPRGTWILCTGGFDNSKRNPNNPDPSKRVTWGDQSFEEMFMGFMDYAELPEQTAAD